MGGTTDIFHEISIRRRRTRTGWKGRTPVLGGSRTKLLKMDEISDLPASGLPARSSQAIRQVSPTAGEVAYSTAESSRSRETYRGYYNGLRRRSARLRDVHGTRDVNGQPLE